VLGHLDLDESDWKKAVKFAIKDMHGLQKEVTKFGNTLQILKKGAKVLGGITLAVAAAGGAALKTAGEFEQYKTSFEVMLGSAEKAEAYIKKIQEYGAVTPFNVSTLVQASKTMLSYGLSADEAFESLKMLGDVTQGDNVKLQSMARNFAQIKALGRLTGIDLREMVNQGFNPLKVISEETGESMESLSDKMSKGAISADMVSEAFKIATAEGGRFYKSMEKQSQTLNGLISTLGDSTEMLAKEFGDALLPAAKDAVKEVTAMIDELRGNEELFGNLGDAIGKIMNVVSELLPILFDLINALLPIVNAVLDLAATLVDILKPAFEQISNIIITLAPIIASLIEDLIKPLAAILGKVLVVALTIVNELLQEFWPILSLIIDILSPLLEGLGKLIVFLAQGLIPVIRTLLIPLRLFNDGLRALGITANEVAGETDAFNDAVGKGAMKSMDEFVNSLNGQQSAFKSHGEMQTAEGKKQAEAREKIEKEYRDKLFDIRATETEKIEKEYQEQLSLAMKTGADLKAIEEYYAIKINEVKYKELNDYNKKIEEENNRILEYVLNLGADQIEIEEYNYNRKSKIIDDEIARRNELVEAAKKQYGAEDWYTNELVKDYEESIKAKVRLDEEHNKRVEELNNEWVDDVKKTISQIDSIYNTLAGSIGDVFGDIGNIFTMSLENDLVTLKNYYGKMLESTEEAYVEQYNKLENLYDKRLISTREYNSRKEELQKQEADETNRIQEEQKEKEVALKKRIFESDKSLKISQIWIDLGKAIMSLWSTCWNLGPIAGPIFAGVMTGVMTGIAGAQTGAIANQQFPQYAAGGDFDAGPAIVGEKGAELAFFRQPGHIFSNEDSKKLLNSGDFNFTIQGDIKSDVDLERMMQRMNSMYRSRQRGIIS
jgi:tape measure domain-containing protein